MTYTFTEFAEQVRRAKLTPKDCGYSHWQILGGASLVNFYPSTKRGPRMYVDGSKAGSHRSVTVADAIAAANTPPTKTKGTKRRQRRSGLRRVQPETTEQDARSNETRKGDAMKAEKFKSVLTRFDATLTTMARRSLNSKAAVRDVQTLIDVLRDLDQHRLEMEAVETSSPCKKCGETLQFYDGAICLKCQEKVRQEMEPAESPKCSNCNVELCGHGVSLCPECSEAEEVEPTQSPDERLGAHIASIDSHRRRLDDNCADSRDRIEAIEERLKEIERVAGLTDQQVAVHRSWLRGLPCPCGPPDSG